MATATDRDTRAVVALSGIIWAYFDRLAEGDWAKATAVLSSFQGLYNASVTSVKAIANAGGVSTPTALVASGAWSADTRRAAQVVLAYSSPPGDRLIEMLEAMPDTSASLGAWFTELRGALSREPYFEGVVELVRTTPISGLSAKLTQLYAEQTQGATPTTGPQIDFDRMINRTRPPSTAAVDAVTSIAEPLEVVGTAVKSQMPLWGWIAIGTGLVAAAGILAWGVYTKPRGG